MGHEVLFPSTLPLLGQRTVISPCCPLQPGWPTASHAGSDSGRQWLLGHPYSPHCLGPLYRAPLGVREPHVCLGTVLSPGPSPVRGDECEAQTGAGTCRGGRGEQLRAGDLAPHSTPTLWGQGAQGSPSWHLCPVSLSPFPPARPLLLEASLGHLDTCPPVSRAAMVAYFVSKTRWMPVVCFADSGSVWDVWGCGESIGDKQQQPASP